MHSISSAWIEGGTHGESGSQPNRLLDFVRAVGICLAAFASGAASLAYEICWSRALVIPLGNSGFATAFILSGFMLGMGGGAYLGGRWSERAGSPLRVYALLELALALYAFVAPQLLHGLSWGAVHGSVFSGSVLRYASALLLIAVPGIAMGASLPLLVRELTGSRPLLGKVIGLVYGFNTGGATLGATAAGFFGIAAFGVHTCSMLAGEVSAFAAAVAFLVSLLGRHGIPVRQAKPG